MSAVISVIFSSDEYFPKMWSTSLQYEVSVLLEYIWTDFRNFRREIEARVDGFLKKNVAIHIGNPSIILLEPQVWDSAKTQQKL